MPSKRYLHLSLLVLTAVLAGLYWYGAGVNSRKVNLDLQATDQGAYMNYAGKMYRSHYAFVGGRNRMPVYPFLLTLIYPPDQDDEAFFARGKAFNTALSLGLLVGIFLLLRRSFPLMPSLTLTVVTAFTVFIFKAAYVQCELLYYSLNFLVFLLFCRLMQRPSWKLAVLAGATAGITHLTKAAILPAVVLFLAMATVWFLSRPSWSGPRGEHGRGSRAGLVTVALVGVSFFAVIYPYISTSKRVYGRYFYNVNSSFYMWYENHAQVRTGTRAHGDREGWPDLPPEEIPGPVKYFREHSLGHIVGRVLEGLQKIHQNASSSYGYYKYLLLYAGFALVAVARDRGRILRGFKEAWPPAVLFGACYLAGYLLLYSWISISNWGVNRLSLQMFLPLMFGLLAVISASSLSLPSLRFRGVGVSLAQIFHGLVLVVLAVDLWFIMTDRLASMYGGS